jgi:hypothetical protein
MGDLFRLTISSLPTVASSPFAFVAYIVVVLAWLIIAWRVKRNKNLLENLVKLPENDRLRAFETEVGHIPIKEGLSPEQYLRSRIHYYYFLAFSILCLVIVTIFVVSAVIGRKQQGTATSDISLYEVEGKQQFEPFRDSQPEFEPDRNHQDIGVAVKNDEDPSGCTVTYTYDRVDERKIQINPQLPYLSLLSLTEPIPNYIGCSINFPRLSIKIVNNTEQTLVITEVAINVKSSKVNTLPILSVKGSISAPNKLFLENEGWSDLINPVVRFNIVDENSCSNVNFADTENVRQLPTIQRGASVDISREISKYKYSSNSSLCVYGQVSYNTENGRMHIVNFKESIFLHVRFPMLMIPSYTYDLFLEADKSNYIKRLPISHEIKSGDSDLLILQVATNKWSQFDLDFSFRTSEGKYLPGNEVLLDIFVPRSVSSSIAGHFMIPSREN